MFKSPTITTLVTSARPLSLLLTFVLTSRPCPFLDFSHFLRYLSNSRADLFLFWGVPALIMNQKSDVIFNTLVWTSYCRFHTFSHVPIYL